MAGLNPVFLAPWLTAIPNYYPCDEQDPKATGIRRKKNRFEEILTQWCSMLSEAFTVDLSSIMPDLPRWTLESYTQSAGWSAAIYKNGKWHLVSGVCAGFIGEWTEYYLPKGVIVSNPYAPEINGQYYFGKNAVLLRNDTNMQGILPILAPLAEMRVETNVSLVQAMENLRIVNIIHAKGSRMKEAALSFFKQIRWGRPGIVTGQDSKVKWSGSSESPVVEALPTGGVPSNYIIQFIEAANFINASLFNTFGLQANGNMKREKLNDSETSMNDDTLRPVIDNMLECRKEFVRQLNDDFGLSIPEPELAGAWKVRKLESSLVEAKDELVEKVEDEPEDGPEAQTEEVEEVEENEQDT